MSEHERPGVERDDDIARLLRLGGAREAVPAERLARVRETARAAWARRVARRTSRRRALWIATAAASIVLAIVVLPRSGILDVAPDGGAARPLVVEALSGTVRLGASTAVAVGDTIELDIPLTTAEDGRVALRLSGGHSLRLDSETTIAFASPRTIDLRRGALYVDSGTGPRRPRPLEIRTSAATIHEIGTQFAVRLAVDGALAVQLREGAVIVDRDGTEHRVHAGTELSLDADGRIDRRRIAPDGTDWAWAETIAPPIELAGRTARAFLDEVARERGWTLVFADEHVAREASSIVLGGALERMPLDDALDAVLPTCRMSWRVAGGRLIVGPESES